MGLHTGFVEQFFFFFAAAAAAKSERFIDTYVTLLHQSSKNYALMTILL